jgi:hypothetical protein
VTSEVVETVSVSVVDAVDGFVIPSSTTLTVSPAAIESPVNKLHTTTVADELKQLPTPVPDVESVTDEPTNVPVAVPDGNVTVI